MVFAIGCSSSAPSAPSCPPPSGKLVVTADWLNRSLTLLDYARVIDPACSDDDAKTGAIDLSAYAPGPIELALTPDGARAVVAIGEGSVAFTMTQQPIPPGGGVLVVDLATKSVLYEVKTPAAPEGIALTAGGKYAFSANFGDDAQPGMSISTIDVLDGSVTDTVVAGRPKQIGVGTAATNVGLVSIADGGGVQAFSPAGTPIAKTGADPSGIAVFREDHLGDMGPTDAYKAAAVVANAVGLSISVVEIGTQNIDGTFHASASTSATVPLSAAPYGVTLIPGTKKLAITTILAGTALVIVDASTNPPAVADPIPLEGGAFPLTAAVDSAGAFAFVAHGKDHALSVVDLNARQLVVTRHLDWLAQAGPTYVAVQP